MSSKATIVYGLAVAAALGAWALASPPRSSTQSQHRCAGEAVEQARRLLAFHVGPDDRIEIQTSVKPLAPLRNPANRTQRLDVLEVWGHVYKGQYRMRLIYAQLPGECVLMGQEILEYAAL